MTATPPKIDQATRDAVEAFQRLPSETREALLRAFREYSREEFLRMLDETWAEG